MRRTHADKRKILSQLALAYTDDGLKQTNISDGTDVAVETAHVLSDLPIAFHGYQTISVVSSGIISGTPTLDNAGINEDQIVLIPPFSRKTQDIQFSLTF